MLTDVQMKRVNYIRIISVLKTLRGSGQISEKEYFRAKKYYQKLTGADIVIVD